MRCLCLEQKISFFLESLSVSHLYANRLTYSNRVGLGLKKLFNVGLGRADEKYVNAGSDFFSDQKSGSGLC